MRKSVSLACLLSRAAADPMDAPEAPPGPESLEILPLRMGTDCWRQGAAGFTGLLLLPPAPAPPEVVVVLALSPIPAGADIVLLYGYFRLADKDLEKGSV